jgi:putative endonuclease
MRRIGDAFEDRACAHLERAGLRLLTRNFHTRYGELDLVMREGDTLVFVEVRYRRDRAFGGAGASVTRAKQDKLIRAAQGFLAAHPEHAQRPCRFDVVSFDGPRETARCDWQRNAFETV